MAVLTNEQKARIGKRCADEFGPVGNRADLYAALQAIEDKFEDVRAAISTAIDAATSVSYTNPQKRILVKHWLAEKLRMGG